MTAALFGFEEIPPVVPRALRVPWAMAAMVVGIDASAVDVGYESAARPPRSRLGRTRVDWLGTGRMSVHVRTDQTGDRLLCTLLHEAIHVRVLQMPDMAWLEGPHGPVFRAEVDAVCDRLGLPRPRPRRYCFWPEGARQAVAAAAIRKSAS